MSSFLNKNLEKGFIFFMNKEEHEYFITQRDGKKVIKVTVPKEFYYEHYRPFWREQKAKQKSGECRCPKEHLWECDGMCFDCPYYHNLNLSLDAFVTTGDSSDGNMTYHEIIPDKSGVDPKATNALLLEEIYEKLETNYPEGIAICQAVEDTKTLRKAAEHLNMSWSTFNYRYKKVKKIAKKIKSEEIDEKVGPKCPKSSRE